MNAFIGDDNCPETRAYADERRALIANATRELPPLNARKIHSPKLRGRADGVLAHPCAPLTLTYAHDGELRGSPFVDATLLARGPDGEVAGFVEWSTYYSEHSDDPFGDWDDIDQVHFDLYESIYEDENRLDRELMRATGVRSHKHRVMYLQRVVTSSSFAGHRLGHALVQVAIRDHCPRNTLIVCKPFPTHGVTTVAAVDKLRAYWNRIGFNIYVNEFSLLERNARAIDPCLAYTP